MSEDLSINGPDALLVGTGEYTTGYVGNTGTKSDKTCGVVGLVMFDLRRRCKLGGRIGLCGTTGKKFKGIRDHLKRTIGDTYSSLKNGIHFESFPNDDVERDPEAFLKALDSFKRGDIVTVFTPDETHFSIVCEAIRRGMHVMVTKPIVKTLEEHLQIVRLAEEYNVLVMVEVHKRFDPIYSDARNRIRELGDFGFFTSYMSQPKFQLETFKSWAGKSSDISYYLNSHHIDFHAWALSKLAIPDIVYARGSKGISKDIIGVDAEDTISLLVDWVNIESGNIGVANYTASWAAAKSDVHSQQRFFYLGHKGEITVDQAHRGYTVASEREGFHSINPLYMRYTPDDDGNYVGQSGYGYKSFELFLDAVNDLRRNSQLRASQYDNILPTARSTLIETAILEAGRKSLDLDSPMAITYDNEGLPSGTIPKVSCI